MPSRASIVPTVGEIARRLGVPVHRVEYVVRARGIRPSGRAANIRVFTDADVARIGAEVRRIDAGKPNAVCRALAARGSAERRKEGDR